jgi:hypothetical protein
MQHVFLINVLGAPGSGKSTLARDLVAALRQAGLRSALLPPSEPLDARARDHELIVLDSPALPLAGSPRADLNLLMALDLPVPEGTDRAAQRQQDQQLRTALLQAGLGWSVIAGHGPARLQAALAAREAELRRRRTPSGQPGRWRHACGRCGDPDCEQRLFAALAHSALPGSER